MRGIPQTRSSGVGLPESRSCSSAVVYIEEVERLNHSVLQDFEVVLFQAFHWVTLGVGHDDVHDHAPNLYRELMRGRLRGLGICNGEDSVRNAAWGSCAFKAPIQEKRHRIKETDRLILATFHIQDDFYCLH